MNCTFIIFILLINPGKFYNIKLFSELHISYPITKPCFIELQSQLIDNNTTDIRIGIPPFILLRTTDLGIITALLGATATAGGTALLAALLGTAPGRTALLAYTETGTLHFHHCILNNKCIHHVFHTFHEFHDAIILPIHIIPNSLHERQIWTPPKYYYTPPCYHPSWRPSWQRHDDDASVP